MELVPERDRIVASGWYAANIGPPCVAIEDAVAEGRITNILARSRAGRGLLIYRAARARAGAALRRRERGALTALALAAAFGGPPIVILELIPDRPARPGPRRVLKRAWFRAVERPIVRRGMRAGQALSAAERIELAALFGIPVERLVHVPFALARTGEAHFTPASQRAGVLSTGRAACDWETLFAAAAGAEWPLTVVCGDRDRDRVEALNRGARARVLSEISRDEHDRLMRAAAVFAMPLFDDGLSAGHVRLMTATELGAPVVASRVRTLDGYVVDGRTAILVPPGDAGALRAAIDELLADPVARQRLADAALERGRGRLYAGYFADLGRMLAGVIGPAAHDTATKASDAAA